MWLFTLLAALLLCNHNAFSKPLPAPHTISFPKDLNGTWTLTFKRAGKPEKSTAQLRMENGILQIEVLAPKSLAKEPRITHVTLSQKGKGTYVLGDPSWQLSNQRYALVSKDAQGNFIQLAQTRYDIAVQMPFPHEQYEKDKKRVKDLSDLIIGQHFQKAASMLWETMKINEYLVKETANTLSKEVLEQGMKTKNGRLFYDQLYYALYKCWSNDWGESEMLPHMGRILAAKMNQVVPIEKYKDLENSDKTKIFPIGFEHILPHKYQTTHLNIDMRWDNTVFAGYKGVPAEGDPYSYENPPFLLYSPRFSGQRSPFQGSSTQLPANMEFGSGRGVGAFPLQGIPRETYLSMCALSEYAKDAKTLPPEICRKSGEKSYGVPLNGDEPIRIHYVGTGVTTYTLPLELLVAEKLQDRAEVAATVQRVTLASTPSMVIFGAAFGGVVAGAEAGSAAAAGGGLRALATRLGPKLLTLGYRVDQGTMILGNVILLIDDYREEIEKQFGEKGKKFLNALDYVQSGIAIYGLARMVQVGATQMYRSAYADVKPAYNAYQVGRSLRGENNPLGPGFEKLEILEQELVAATQAGVERGATKFAAPMKAAELEMGKGATLPVGVKPKFQVLKGSWQGSSTPKVPPAQEQVLAVPQQEALAATGTEGRSLQQASGEVGGAKVVMQGGKPPGRGPPQEVGTVRSQGPASEPERASKSSPFSEQTSLRKQAESGGTETQKPAESPSTQDLVLAKEQTIPVRHPSKHIPTAEEVQGWQKNFRMSGTPDYKPHNQYEIQHTGPKNIVVEGGGEKIAADGISASGYLQETKFVENIRNSPYVEGSNCYPPVREKVLRQLDSEFSRYKAIIDDKNTPIIGLELITNVEEARPFFERLFRKHEISGYVIIKP